MLVHGSWFGAGLIALVCIKETRLPEVVDLTNRLQAIAREMEDTPSEFHLLDSSPFCELLRTAESWRGASLSALRQPHLGSREKEIAVLAMQALRLEQLVSFQRDVLRLAEEGTVSGEVLRHAVLPGAEWNTRLAENHRDPNVRRFLTELTRSSVIEKNVREYAATVLDGSALKHIQELRAAGMLPKATIAESANECKP